MLTPETRYTRSGDVSIAYQVLGSGGLDLVFVMGWVSNIDQFWAEPSFARFLRRLASFSRLILFDKRGTGLSDRVPPERMPSLDERMDDVRAVMDAVGSRRAALVGVSEGGPLCLLFAATHPDRTAAVVVLGGYALRLRTAGETGGFETPEETARILERIPHEWGGSFGLADRAPSRMSDERFVRWWGGYLRSSASPSAAVVLTRMNSQIDVRDVLPTIRVPVLVIHRRGDRAVPAAAGRAVADAIASARFIEVEGDDHLPFVGDQDRILDEVERFLTGERTAPETDRVLLTVMRLELADPVRVMGRLGDARWRTSLEELGLAARTEIASARGREMRIGAGAVAAAFDGPARAVRCAAALVAAAARLELPLRAGLHTGECAVLSDDVVGPAVEIAERIARGGQPGDVLVSSTVCDLVAGSGLYFDQLRSLPAGLPAGLTVLRLVSHLQAAPLSTSRAAVAGVRLTPREREIAGLVALGLTNRQIAEELVISPATVDRHVANVLVKLGAHHRAQIAAWAVTEDAAQQRGAARE